MNVTEDTPTPASHAEQGPYRIAANIETVFHGNGTCELAGGEFAALFHLLDYVAVALGVPSDVDAEVRAVNRTHVPDEVQRTVETTLHRLPCLRTDRWVCVQV